MSLSGGKRDNGRLSANYSSPAVAVAVWVGDTLLTTQLLADYDLDHVAWWFCPQRLRNYKSQGHDSSDFLFLQALHPTDLNVHVGGGDPSKRVPEKWLEYIWAMPSPSRVLHLPLWAKWDDVVQGMINREEVNEILYYGDPELQKKPLPARNTVSSSVSSWSDSGVEGNAEGLRGPERQGLQEDSAIGPDLNQHLAKNTTNVDVTLASPSAEISTGLSGSKSHSAREAPTHGQFRQDASDLGVHEKDASDLGVHEITRTSQAQSYKIHKRSGAKKETTRKATLSDKIQSRAQDVLKFLAGDSGACAASLLVTDSRIKGKWSKSLP